MLASLASTPTSRSEGPPSGSSSDQLGRLPAPEVLATVSGEGVTFWGRGEVSTKKPRGKMWVFPKIIPGKTLQNGWFIIMEHP